MQFSQIIYRSLQIPVLSSWYQKFLSRQLCQDPPEKFFGCQRQVGRTHDNTTVKEFEQNTQALRVVDSFCRSSIKSNCRGNSDLVSEDHGTYPLPKRPKVAKPNLENNRTYEFTPTELGEKQK